MLNSLYIKNYRNLKELTIKSLGQITLLTGKNNTGKSSVLEAIAIYVAKGDIRMIYELLEERGEFIRETGAKKNFTEDNVKLFSSLFYDREIVFYHNSNVTYDSSVSRDAIENIIINKNNDLSDINLLSIRFIKYHAMPSGLPERPIALHIQQEYMNEVLRLENEKLYSFNYEKIRNYENLKFIGTRDIYKVKNAENWDKIIFSEKENHVIEALQIIEPTIERLAFIGDNQNERTAIIKLSNMPNTLPLRSMGDGINRILTIILALVNAENGYLLIDEFENGLHHSVQSKLWEIIFNLAKKLNVQVFATTHSNDCIYAFEESLNDKDNTLTGKLIRLDNKKGMIKEVEFDAESLKIVTDSQIEIR